MSLQPAIRHCAHLSRTDLCALSLASLPSTSLHPVDSTRVAMPPRAMRTLTPLPLMDEQALLSACAASDPPMHAQHATALWKAMLKHELDRYHPGYAERMSSRLASRNASRLASRNASRRPSIGADGSSSAAQSESKRPIAEGPEEEEEEEQKESTAVAEEQSAKAATVEVEREESKEDDAASVAASSPRSAASASSGSMESEAARFAAEQAVRLKLEAEDDARLEGLSVFPRSKFCPSEEDLADAANAVHNVTPVTPAVVGQLPGRMYPMLAEKFSFLTSRLQSHKTSADGSTTKLLIRLQDGQHIESVIMRHKAGDVATGRVEQRITLCVSSQVGCAMGCTFCATGTMGMRFVAPATHTMHSELKRTAEEKERE